MPPLGMLDCSRIVEMGLRCPGKGCWLGSDGMLLRGSCSSGRPIQMSCAAEGSWATGERRQGKHHLRASPVDALVVYIVHSLAASFLWHGAG